MDLVFSMKIIMKCVHGSHLYGTNTENSDVDYMGIYINEPGEEYKKTITNSTGDDKSKNTKYDVDEKLFHLSYFFELIKKNDIHTIDLLHVKPEQCLISTSVWEYIYKNRKKLYHKNITNVIDYCFKQASKYGIKGSRLHALEETIKLCDGLFINHNIKGRIEDIIQYLPEHEFITPFIYSKIPMMEICNRKFQYTCPIKKFKESLQSVVDKNGERAKMACNNEGIDWKAISHAFRAVYQILLIMDGGGDYELSFPLPKTVTEELIELKQGKISWDVAKYKLEQCIETLEEYKKISIFPETLDHRIMKEFINSVYGLI